MHIRLNLELAVLLFGMAAGLARAESLLTAGDFVIAIDSDPAAPDSSSPGAEGVEKSIDGLSTTKYLNFGQAGTGLIVTPGSSLVKSFQLTTANDAPERDPAAYQLFGTNSPIASTNHSAGLGEPWTLIGSGSVSLPDTRQTAGPVVDVANNTSYSSYKLIFNQVKNPATANSMQVAEVQMFNGGGGEGTPVLSPALPILAIGPLVPNSSHPAAEAPPGAIDGNPATKYLNFGRENSGLIVTPSKGPSVVTALQITTANDAPARDPSAFAIFGRNGPITTVDNGTGLEDEWTPIASGDFVLPDARQTPGDVITFANDKAFTSYKVIFTENKGPDDAADSIQLADVQLTGTVVPEPSVLGLLVLAGLGSIRRHRR